MDIVSDKEKRKYSGRKRKTIPMMISCSIIFLLIGMALAQPPVGNGMLDDLTDCNVPTPNDNEVLTYDTATANWTAEELPTGVEVLNDLTDVDTTGVSDNDFLKYSGGNWYDFSLFNTANTWLQTNTFNQDVNIGNDCTATNFIGDGSQLTNLSELWNRSNNTLYTTTNNDSVQINGSFNVSTIVNITIEGSEYSWGDGDWDYYKTITIESDYVDSELTDFPILVSIDDATGDKCKANGEDIRFLLTDDTTELNYEIEKWVDNEDRIVWVKIPTITHTTDTIILMYYGNSGASDSQNPSGVWDSNYKGVYHLDDTTFFCYDSTGNGNDAFYMGDLPERVTGKVGYGQDLDGNIDCIALPSGCHSPLYGTVEMWVSQDDSSVTGYYYNRDEFGIFDDYIILHFDGSAFEFYNYGDWYIDGGSVSSSMRYFSFAWVDGSQNFRINDVSIGTDTATPISDFGYFSIRVGDSHLGDAGLDGKLDEIRISNIKRTDAWRDTSYHSQTQTSGFLVWGDETVVQEISYYDDYIDLLKVDVDLMQVNFSVNITLQDDGRVKRHVRVTAPSWKKGVSEPTDAYVGIFPVLSFDKITDDIIHYSLVIPYRIETDSNISVIVDWCYTGTNDVGTVNWKLTYLNLGVGESVDGTTTTISETSTGTHVSGDLIRTVFTEKITGAIAHHDIGLKLFRDISEDTLDTDAHLIQVHFEFIEDKLGKPMS